MLPCTISSITSRSNVWLMIYLAYMCLLNIHLITECFWNVQPTRGCSLRSVIYDPCWSQQCHDILDSSNNHPWHFRDNLHCNQCHVNRYLLGVGPLIIFSCTDVCNDLWPNVNRCMNSIVNLADVRSQETIPGANYFGNHCFDWLWKILDKYPKWDYC